MNISMKEAVKRGLRPGVILTSLLIMGTLLGIGAVSGKNFIAMLNAFFQTLMINGGWLISLGTLFFIVFLLVIMFHPIGRVKLGGKDAKPEYSLWNWFAISLCAGIGTGIVFWGPVEPLRFAVEPQLSMGLTSGSREAVLWSLSKSYLHWSFAPYAEYAIFGVIIAFAFYNLGASFSVSAGFTPLLGKTAEKPWFRGIIDSLTAFAITGGCAGSLGYGLLQISSGLNSLFGIPQENIVLVAICVVIVVTFTLSSISGMNKGIRWLSDKNAWMFLSLMVLALLFGPMQWICNLFVESIGDFFQNFVGNITAVSAFDNAGQAVGSAWYENSELWSQWWDQCYFVDFLSFGPVVGLFSIKLAKGRTLREYLVMNWVVPAAFGIVWFAIFGGLAMDIQFNFTEYAGRVDLLGCESLFEYMQVYGNEAMMLKVVEVIPFASVLKPIILLLVILSFVTMADSTTSTVALMSIRDNKGVEEAPIAIKLFWAILMGAASLLFTLTGSIDGIKIVKTIAGFPILLMGIVMVVLFLIYIIKNSSNLDVKDMM